MPYFELYLTDTDKDGDLEVHDKNCHLTSGKSPFRELGFHGSCQSAVREAKRLYPLKSIDGCAVCVPTCHTR